MIGFLRGVCDAFIWVVKSGFKVCFRGFFGESAWTLIRAAPNYVAFYRLGLGFNLGDALLDV